MNSKFLLLLFIFMIILIITSSVSYLYLSGYFYSVRINGENIIIKSSNIELIKKIEVSYVNSTIIAHGNELITFNITIINNNTLLSVKLTKITVSSPFILTSESLLPILISPNSSTSIIISIKTPEYSYSSVLTILLYIENIKNI
ncbi:hypothetical protein DFR86_07880 [Acidianus sulfidivorans JP7]|uniref:DUF11 domain-containing protein n=1 Tax=Acidianus sulfidivorans JP7 TaxID=619593 RepID=A0A2U9IN98_9CREN|nr:hypothetical protein [Acidianus sulfidivorans]AWR97476.1 hypothetical protein DFR86_07880 [Acidianus sulfidivorans JP7]